MLPITKKKQNPQLSDLTLKSSNSPQSLSRSKPFSHNFPNKTCILCQNKQKPISFSITIQKALYNKFASSQNYFYTREINDILLGNRTERTLLYKDFLAFDEETEFLKRVYTQNDFTCKFRILTEYYKYHKDIPRLYMLPVTTYLNKYHDKKRRLDYIKITKIIKEEHKKEGKTYEEENLMESLGESSSEMLENHERQKKINVPLGEECILKDFLQEKTRKVEISNFTLFDWQSKLKEITNGSICVDQSNLSYLESNLNKKESIGNLSEFLEYMNKKEPKECIKTAIIPNNSKNLIQSSPEYKQINLKEDFQISSSNLTNKNAKPFLFEKPKINTQKLSLTKKLALIQEKTKGRIISLTERSEEDNKKKFREILFKKLPENGKARQPEIKKQSPLLSPKNHERKVTSPKNHEIKVMSASKNSKTLHSKKESYFDYKKLKLDKNLLNMLLVSLVKKSDKQNQISEREMKKTPTKQSVSREGSKSKEKGTGKKIDENSIKSPPSNLSNNAKKENSESDNLQKSKKMSHNRILSNEIEMKRMSLQPNPLYFEKKLGNKTNHIRPETSRDKPIRTNKASLLRFSYNNIMKCVESKCLTERNDAKTPKTLQNIKTPKSNCHKYAKSESKLLKKEEQQSHSENPGQNQFVTYNNNNFVNIFLNEQHKIPSCSSSQICFDKIKGVLRRVEITKKAEVGRKSKENVHLNLHLDLNTG